MVVGGREGQAPCYTFTRLPSHRAAMFVEVGHSFTQAAPLQHTYTPLPSFHMSEAKKGKGGED